MSQLRFRRRRVLHDIASGVKDNYADGQTTDDCQLWNCACSSSCQLLIWWRTFTGWCPQSNYYVFEDAEDVFIWAVTQHRSVTPQLILCFRNIVTYLFLCRHNIRTA